MSENTSASKRGIEHNIADRLFEFAVALVKLTWGILYESFQGLRYGTLPFRYLIPLSLIVYYAMSMRWDYYPFYWLKWEFLYPYSPKFPKLYDIYHWFWVASPFWIWGASKMIQRRRFNAKIEGIFLSAGIKNGIGRTPTAIFDKPSGEDTRRLRLNRVGLPLKDFEMAKPCIEGGLGAYIDHISEDREAGTVDMVYSKTPMTEHYEPNDCFQSKLEFSVGVTRSQEVKGDLSHTPHLLIAGQTGGGKSTFLRQLITTLYLSNEDMSFSLIDLKGGLEFQLFEHLPRVKVLPSLSQAIRELKILKSQLERRMDLLRSADCHDLNSFLNLSDEDKVSRLGEKAKELDLKRHLIVVDEAAEVFVGRTGASRELAEARMILSQVARQGRAVGIHLVIATQRPDARALDTQVKANMAGVLSFQMPNNVSSMTVLDSGRASQLPDIAGRAIWKVGGKLKEVQTPFLSMEKASSYLSTHRVKKEKENKPTRSQDSSLEIGV